MVCNRKKMPPSGRRAKDEGRRAKDESITLLRDCRQLFVNRAPLVLSHPCRTSQTMHRQRLDNASSCLSDPCGTSAALPLPRPSRTTKPTSHRVTASVGMNADGTTPPSVMPQPSVEDSAALLQSEGFCVKPFHEELVEVADDSREQEEHGGRCTHPPTGPAPHPCGAHAI